MLSFLVITTLCGLFMTSMAGGYDDTIHCDDNYEAHQDSQMCFRILDNEKTWKSANLYCLDESWDMEGLLDIDDASLNNFLKGKLAEGKSYWIGKDKSWKSYSNWAAGEPNQSSSCVAMDSSGKWSTKPCSESHPYICGGWVIMSKK